MEKIGLVLGGGGAKGAFAAGALKAIYDKIYPKWFDIVSGTSIGAFNGVLASLGQVDKMVSLWRKLEAKNIYRFNFISFYFFLCRKKMV